MWNWCTHLLYKTLDGIIHKKKSIWIYCHVGGVDAYDDGYWIHDHVGNHDVDDERVDCVAVVRMRSAYLFPNLFHYCRRLIRHY